jgi:hypothetical protein
MKIAKSEDVCAIEFWAKSTCSCNVRAAEKLRVRTCMYVTKRSVATHTLASHEH